MGVILAGVFTEGAINQLLSRNFSILYFEYKTVISAFNAYNIDASFDEDTSADDFEIKIRKWENCTTKDKIIEKLAELNKDKVDSFFQELEQSVSRYITEIRLLPLFGSSIIFNSPEEAIIFLNTYNQTAKNSDELVRFEIKIVYSNGDNIEAKFNNKTSANQFLQAYKSPNFRAD